MNDFNVSTWNQISANATCYNRNINIRVCGKILILPKFGKAIIKTSWSQHWLQVTVQLLYFEAAKQADRKLSALIRIYKFKSIKPQRLFMTSFIESQFANCPIVMMCCDEISDNSINDLQKLPLRTVYNDNVSIFEKLLKKR